jgi:hypothetical protein
MPSDNEETTKKPRFSLKSRPHFSRGHQVRVRAIERAIACPSSEHLAQLAAQISGVQASSGG